MSLSWVTAGSQMYVWLVIMRSLVWSLPIQASYFRGDWSWNTSYGHSFPSTDSRRAIVSFWWKNMHKYCLTTQDKTCPGKVWVGWPAWHDLNSFDWAVKLQPNQLTWACKFVCRFMQTGLCSLSLHMSRTGCIMTALLIYCNSAILFVDWP